MKRNLKGSFIISLIYCMGIGALTLFIGTLYPVYHADGEINNKINEDNRFDEHNDSLGDEISINSNDSSQETYKALSQNVPTTLPTPTSEPTPPPVYEFEEGGYPDIEKFFLDYYVAKNSCDYSILKSLLTDPEKIKPLPDLQKETRFLDDIRNITCYISKSYEENAYIVYVYYELKYINIKTVYPQLDKFYLVADKEGNFKIYSSEMEEPLKTYYEERDQDEKVQELIENTNEKAKEALNNDVDLRVYLEALNN